MSLEQNGEVLRGALETIREATYAEFQIEPSSRREFNHLAHVCPYCRRASTAGHLHDNWALIQSAAARALRDIEK